MKRSCSDMKRTTRMRVDGRSDFTKHFAHLIDVLLNRVVLHGSVTLFRLDRATAHRVPGPDHLVRSWAMAFDGALDQEAQFAVCNGQDGVDAMASERGGAAGGCAAGGHCGGACDRGAV